MKYMLLIHQGTTPLPGTPEWDKLSEDEQQAVYADYQAVNETEGVTPGFWMQQPEMATTVRVEDGKTLTTDGPFVAVKEALGGYLFLEADDIDAAIELAVAEAGDVEAALTLVDGLELDSYHYHHATRAELLRRLDRVDEARAAYERALELVHSEAERRFLEERLAELRD